MATGVELARCRGCGRPIVWGRLAGKPHPLDPDVLTIVDDEGTVRRGRVSHFATCPEADAFRKSRDVKLTERARNGFEVRTATGLSLATIDTWGEAIVERERLKRVTRQRLQICWPDTGEPVTRAQGSELMETIERETGQVGLGLDGETPDPRPNSREDLGFQP